MSWLLALILKPFFAVVLIFVAMLLAQVFYRYMPDCKLKRFLSRPLPWYRGSRRR